MQSKSLEIEIKKRNRNISNLNLAKVYIERELKDLICLRNGLSLVITRRGADKLLGKEIKRLKDELADVNGKIYSENNMKKAIIFYTKYCPEENSEIFAEMDGYNKMALASQRERTKIKKIFRRTN